MAIGTRMANSAALVEIASRLYAMPYYYRVVH